MSVSVVRVAVRMWQGCGKGVCYCGEGDREGVAGAWQGVVWSPLCLQIP